MKILLVSSIHTFGGGGSSNMLHDIVSYLCMHGHHVEVLTRTSARDQEQRWAVVDETHGYRVHSIPPQRLRGGTSIVMLRRLIALSLSRRYDLILCGVAFPSAVLAYVAGHVTRRPYAVYSHGEDVTQVEGSRLKQALLARALRGACIIMSNSAYTRNHILALGVPPARVIRVTPWINPACFEEAKPERVEALRARLGLEGKRVVLTVARLSPRKGHDTVIRTLPALRARIPNLRYVIVGEGDQQALRALAAVEGVDDLVAFMGSVEHDDLAALFHLCDVHVMVSRWDPSDKQVDGFGIVYLEAAAAGKPSVAGFAGGCPDAVEDGVSGFVVDPISVSEVGQAIYTLLAEPERAAAMGAAGRRRVRAQFTRDALLPQIEHILEDCIICLK